MREVESDLVGADDECLKQPPHLRARRLQAKQALEALAEKLGIDLVRGNSLPPEAPAANLDALDLLDGNDGEQD